MLLDNNPGSGYVADLTATDKGAYLGLMDPTGRQAGLKLDAEQPGLQQFDRPAPKPGP